MFTVEVPCCEVLHVPLSAQKSPVCEPHPSLLAKVLNEVCTSARYLLCLSSLAQVGYETRNVDLRSSNNYHPCGVLSLLLANV